MLIRNRFFSIERCNDTLGFVFRLSSNITIFGTFCAAKISQKIGMIEQNSQVEQFISYFSIYEIKIKIRFPIYLYQYKFFFNI